MPILPYPYSNIGIRNGREVSSIKEFHISSQNWSFCKKRYNNVNLSSYKIIVLLLPSRALGPLFQIKTTPIPLLDQRIQKLSRICIHIFWHKSVYTTHTHTFIFFTDAAYFFLVRYWRRNIDGSLPGKAPEKFKKLDAILSRKGL